LDSLALGTDSNEAAGLRTQHMSNVHLTFQYQIIYCLISEATGCEILGYGFFFAAIFRPRASTPVRVQLPTDIYYHSLLCFVRYFPRDATRSAVMPQYVVCLSVCL